MTGGADADTGDGPSGVDFYARVVEDGEELYEAAAVEGIDGEIALLRRELRRHAKDCREDLDLLLKSIGQLVRAVSARHRMTPARADELERALLSTVERLSTEIYGADGV